MPFQPFAHDWDRKHSSDAEQWNWLAVEITEIRRCWAVGDQAHDRLALLLIDHLVEVIVGREVNAQLAFQIPDDTIEEMREFRDNGGQLPGSLSQVVDDHVGVKQREKIDAHLREKTKYLMKKEFLTPQERDVLDRMHEYRNVAYHRDKLEAGLIRDLVLAYMILATQLLSRHKPIMFVMWQSGPGPIVTPQELPGLLGDGLDVDLKKMALRFSDHSMDRVHGIAAAVTTAQALLRDVENDPNSPGTPILDDDFGRLLMTLSETEPRLQSWVKRAAGLKAKPKSLVDLMLPFIGLDQALSVIEPSVRKLEAVLDWLEQQQINEMRGK